MDKKTKNSRIPRDLRSHVALLSAVAVYVISASLLPDCGVFVNSSIAVVAGAIAIFSA